MAKIGPYFKQSRSPQEEILTQNNDLPSSHDSEEMLSLKAVYPHFAEPALKSNGNEPSLNENLSKEELNLVMEDAKKSYEVIQEIQRHLTQAYQEIMSSKHQKK